MKKPLVSVLCLTYNHDKYVAQAIESILQQKVDFPVEVIIHDDASTDTTVQVIEQTLAKNTNPNIYFKTTFEKQNQYSQDRTQYVNDMFETAQGKYIAVCEGDDYWTDEEKLQKQVAVMEANPQFSLCFHPVKVHVENKKAADYIYPDPAEHIAYTVDELVRRNFIQTNSVMYRKQEYSELNSRVMPFDWYMHLYHARFGTIGYLDEVMAVYRRHASGLWADSYTDQDALLRKFGIQWTALYMELLKMFKKKHLQQLIHGSIVEMIGKLADIDSKYKDNLLERLCLQQPGAMLIYVANLRSEVATLSDHSEKQAAVIEDSVAHAQRLEERNRELEIQNAELLGRNTQLERQFLLRLKRVIKRRVSKHVRRQK